jgi:hypothetical protein
MSNPYQPPVIVGYNANPPSDDGQHTVPNQVKWSTIKTKLTDPLNAFCAAISASVTEAFGEAAPWVQAGGSPDALTAANATPVTSLNDGQVQYLRAVSANATTAPTFAPDAQTARTIVKNGGVALQAGDIRPLQELILRYSATGARWELCNPAGGSGQWTPTDQSGASLTLTINDAYFAIVGKTCTIVFSITYPVTASVNNAALTLPVVAKSTAGLDQLFMIAGGTGFQLVAKLQNAGAQNFTIGSYANTSTLTRNVDLSGQALAGTFTYMTP